MYWRCIGNACTKRMRVFLWEADAAARPRRGRAERG
jgi:hypothetical protein